METWHIFHVFFWEFCMDRLSLNEWLSEIVLLLDAFLLLFYYLLFFKEKPKCLSFLNFSFLQSLCISAERWGISASAHCENKHLHSKITVPLDESRCRNSVWENAGQFVYTLASGCVSAGRGNYRNMFQFNVSQVTYHLNEIAVRWNTNALNIWALEENRSVELAPIAYSGWVVRVI